jgi:hypothetical protein
MHVIFVAPHFPANQRHFVRALRDVGAVVSGIGEPAFHHLDGELQGLLNGGWEQIGNVCDKGMLYGAVRRIQQRGPWVDRLETVVEAHMLAAAEVREATGIPGLPADTVLLCRDKFRMKQHLLERGFPCAAQAEVHHGDDARRFAQHNGFPFILKPRDGAGASGTVKVTDVRSLEQAIAERSLDRGGAFWSAEDFIDGHEGFYDTLTVGGHVVYEAISHYYPRVLTAMRNRFPNPYLVTTNRLDSPGYTELRRLGQGAIRALGIGTSATHMEWFVGTKGLVFNEIGARPPGVNVFDLHGHASRFDIYRAWAEAICFGKVQTLPKQRGCGGLVSLRPERDGTVVAVHGADAIQRKYGSRIYSARLPHPGQPTQPVEAGYRANGYVYATHEDYDACKAMMADIGQSIRIEVQA